MKSSVEALAKSRIDFAPMEILISDKPVGWIESDCIRLCKFMLCIFKNMDRHIAEKDNNSINIRTHTSKMHKTYLLLCNLDVPNTIKDKR